MIWLALLAQDADAKKKKKASGEGVTVTVVVLTTDEEPIPTAVVRHPDEVDRHRVNAATGEYEASELFMPDGSELVFESGMTLQFEVSAPGYVTQIVQYDVRKRNNDLEVRLEELNMESVDIADPVIQFGRDKPRTEPTTAPTN